MLSVYKDLASAMSLLPTAANHRSDPETVLRAKRCQFLMSATRNIQTWKAGEKQVSSNIGIAGKELLASR
jgi:hypothetical protein